MKTLTLSDDSIELILVLLQEHRDILDRAVRRSFSVEATGIFGRTPTKHDMRTANELLLTQETIKVLEKV